MNAIRKSIRHLGLARTLAAVAVCLAADAWRVWLHAIGHHALAAELLEAERELWR